MHALYGPLIQFNKTFVFSYALLYKITSDTYLLVKQSYSKVYGVERHFVQYFSYIVAVSFIGGGNQSTRRRPPTYRMSLTHFITWCCIEYTLPWITGIKMMFVTLVTYIPTWRTRKMVNLNILVFSLFLVYFQILSFQMYRYFNN